MAGKPNAVTSTQSNFPQIDVRQPARLKMTYKEFQEWADEDVHAEWIDREVIIHIPPKELHQALVGFLERLLSLFVELFNLGSDFSFPNHS